MTTIWRPNLDRLYASVAEMEGSESEEEEKDATKKGVKRKRAPPTKGPCEHGVKPRSRCKVCGACPHGKAHCKVCINLRQGRRRSQCGVGGGFCEHGRERSKSKEAGASICEHVAAPSVQVRRVWNLRARPSALSGARNAVGLKSA